MAEGETSEAQEREDGGAPEAGPGPGPGQHPAAAFGGEIRGVATATTKLLWVFAVSLIFIFATAVVPARSALSQYGTERARLRTTGGLTARSEAPAHKRRAAGDTTGAAETTDTASTTDNDAAPGRPQSALVERRERGRRAVAKVREKEKDVKVPFRWLGGLLPIHLDLGDVEMPVSYSALLWNVALVAFLLYVYNRRKLILNLFGQASRRAGDAPAARLREDVAGHAPVPWFWLAPLPARRPRAGRPPAAGPSDLKELLGWRTFHGTACALVGVSLIVLAVAELWVLRLSFDASEPFGTPRTRYWLPVLVSGFTIVAFTVMAAWIASPWLNVPDQAPNDDDPNRRLRRVAMGVAFATPIATGLMAHALLGRLRMRVFGPRRRFRLKTSVRKHAPAHFGASRSAYAAAGKPPGFYRRPSTHPAVAAPPPPSPSPRSPRSTTAYAGSQRGAGGKRPPDGKLVHRLFGLHASRRGAKLRPAVHWVDAAGRVQGVTRIDAAKLEPVEESSLILDDDAIVSRDPSGRGHRVHLSVASFSFEQAALRALAASTGADADAARRADRACGLLLAGIRHDLLYKVGPARRVHADGRAESLAAPSYRLYDLLAGVAVRYQRPDQLKTLIGLVNESLWQRALRDRVKRWRDPNSGFARRWRTRPVWAGLPI